MAAHMAGNSSSPPRSSVTSLPPLKQRRAAPSAPGRTACVAPALRRAAVSAGVRSWARARPPAAGGPTCAPRRAPRGTSVDWQRKPARVDAVEREHRHARGEGRRCARGRSARAARCRPMRAHRRVELLAPVVEVAGDAPPARRAAPACAMKPARRSTWRTRLAWISPGGPRRRAPACRASAPAHAAGRAARSGGRRRRGGRCRPAASATAARCRARRRA